jgi:poly-beta-hydroxyalkanoate depolymerase
MNDKNFCGLGCFFDLNQKLELYSAEIGDYAVFVSLRWSQHIYPILWEKIYDHP